jgi:adenylate cyclase
MCAGECCVCRPVTRTPPFPIPMPNPVRAFVGELRRRRVHTVAAIYAGAAFLVLQVADIAVEPLRLPAWTMALLIVLALVGFVLALVLGWLFQLGPEGLKRAEPVLATGGRMSRNVSWIGLGIVIGLVLVGAYSVVDLPLRGRTSADSIESIAVLPFANLGPGDESEYFGDGLAEELLDGLASIERLRVPARTSSFAFKGQELDVREIGRRLGVEVVLEGSVRRAGDRLRVSAQLVDVASGYTLFSETYERTVDDVFALQTELSRAIIAAIRLDPDAQEAAGAITRAGTSDPHAHDLYLAGLYHFHRRGPNVDSAIVAFGAATSADSDYADAWAGLASAYSVAVFFTTIQPDSARIRGEAAAQRALALDADHAQAHAALGQIAAVYRWDSDAALAHYRRSLELAPAVANTRMWYGASLFQRGRLDEALTELTRARELDPLSAVVAENVGAVLAAQGRIDEAIAEYDRGVRLNPEMLTVRWARSSMFLKRGRCDEAARLAAENLADARFAQFLSLLFMAACAPDFRPQARSVIDTYASAYGQPSGPSPALLLSIYDTIGELDEAERWMRVAYEARFPVLIELLPVYLSDELLARPGARAIVRQIGMDWIYEARAAAAARARG